MKEIKTFILEIFLPGTPENEMADDIKLLDTGIIDSVSMLMLINHLEDTYKIVFDVEEIERDRFNTLKSITDQVSLKVNG